MTSKTCAGCKACLDVCKKDAISFISDEEGFLIPRVDSLKCIDCGLCIKICPSFNTRTKSDNKEEINAFAFQYHNDDVRYNSASGALFPALAKYFIENKGGYVCGCILNSELEAVHVVTKDWDVVLQMQDSKYVQSDMGHCMLEVCRLLKKGTPVLFTGTSCQCAGLLSLIQQKKISTDLLLTIDFFCHGVPSPTLWKEYVNFYSANKHVRPVGYRFRCKKYGWGEKARNSGFLNTFRYQSIQIPKSIQKPRQIYKEDSHSFEARMWRRIFFSNIALRKYCHSCPYTTIDKPSDITMGDFWGVEKFYPSFSDGKGCSMVIIRNQKALKVFSNLENSESLEVSIDEIVARQANAFCPCTEHPSRSEFWSDYYQHGFDYVMRKYMAYSQKTKIKSAIKLFLFHLGIRNYAE